MKEFISPNHLTMAEGELFNWQKIYEYPGNRGRVFYEINVGSMYTMRQCLYNTEEGILHISSMRSDGVQPFKCNIAEAEQIIMMLHKGMKVQILPLYKKE